MIYFVNFQNYKVNLPHLLGESNYCVPVIDRQINLSLKSENECDDSVNSMVDDDSNMSTGAGSPIIRDDDHLPCV